MNDAMYSSTADFLICEAVFSVYKDKPDHRRCALANALTPTTQNMNIYFIIKFSSASSLPSLLPSIDQALRIGNCLASPPIKRKPRPPCHPI